MQKRACLRASPGAHGFLCHGLTASAEGGLLTSDDTLSLQEPLPGLWFRDEVRDFFTFLAQERRPTERRSGSAVSAAEVADALCDVASSDTCVLTAQALLVEYTKWRERPGGLQSYCDELRPDYMVDPAHRARVPDDPTQYRGTLLRHIRADSPIGFLFKRMQRTKRVKLVLRIGLPALVDFLEIPLSVVDGAPRYGLLLVSRPGHMQVIERRGMHCCIMQSSTNSYHLANFLLQLRPLTDYMQGEEFFQVFRKSAEIYTRDMPCEELLEHFRALLPVQDLPGERDLCMERLALMAGEPWSKVLEPGDCPNFYHELLFSAPFHVAWSTPQREPVVAW
mmetsp:Transcript_58522/g.136132  ORF Transcript_58522/g.136132 Transcript_58522/m.136132 type:complete len:337 (-) Transcript_58522:16-1026(-)